MDPSINIQVGAILHRVEGDPEYHFVVRWLGKHLVQQGEKQQYPLPAVDDSFSVRVRLLLGGDWYDLQSGGQFAHKDFTFRVTPRLKAMLVPPTAPAEIAGSQNWRPTAWTPQLEVQIKEPPPATLGAGEGMGVWHVLRSTAVVCRGAGRGAPASRVLPGGVSGDSRSLRLQLRALPGLVRAPALAPGPELRSAYGELSAELEA